MKYPYMRPVLPKPESWLPILQTSYDQHYFSNFGPLATQFEKQLAENYLTDGYRATLATSNTLGLQAVLTALDIRGRYVILPDFTFPATLHAVIAAGGKPIICDVLKETGELDPASVKQALSKYGDVAAIIYVRCYGFINDITPFRSICEAHDLLLIVDAAASLAKPSDQSFGSEAGEIEVFSLHATKVFATGEGGVIAAPEAISDKIRRTINFGFNEDRTFHDGINAKMDEYRAAIGLSMLDQIGKIVEHRQSHAAAYKSLVEKYDFIRTFDVDETSAWSCFPIFVPEDHRETCIAFLAEAGVGTKKYYAPGLADGYVGQVALEIVSVENSRYLQNSVLCLPIYSEPIETFWEGLSEAIETSLQKLQANL